MRGKQIEMLCFSDVAYENKKQLTDVRLCCNLESSAVIRFCFSRERVALNDGLAFAEISVCLEAKC